MPRLSHQPRPATTCGGNRNGRPAGPRRRPSRTRAAAVALSALAALLLVPAVATVGASASAGRVAATSPAEVPMAVEAAVDSLGKTTFPSVYGDIAVINNGAQIAVYLTTPTPIIEAAFQALAPAGALVFRTTPHSISELDSIHQRLTDQWQSLIGEGIDVIEFGPDILIGKEDIGVENVTPSQIETLSAAFGADAINVYNVTPQQADAGQLLVTRVDDIAPYNGGDAIVHETTLTKDVCTSGFGIKINGNPRLLSAGHCYDTGADIINEKCTSFSDCSGGRAAMGSVTQNGLGDTAATATDSSWTVLCLPVAMEMEPAAVAI